MGQILGNGKYLKVSENFWPIFLTREISILTIDDKFDLIALKRQRKKQIILIRPQLAKYVEDFDMAQVLSCIPQLKESQYSYYSFDNRPLPIDVVRECNEMFSFSLAFCGVEYFFLLPVMYSEGFNCEGTIGFVDETNWLDNDLNLNMEGKNYTVFYSNSLRSLTKATIGLIRLGSAKGTEVPLSQTRRVVYDGSNFVSSQIHQEHQ